VRGKDFMKAGIDLVAFYRNNPVIAAEDLLNVELAPPQAVILEDMWFKPYCMVSAGRGSGKSFILSVFGCLRGLLYPGDSVGILAPSFRQSKFVFAEVSKRYDEAPILREACLKRPIVAADRCYLHFKAPKNRIGSKIEAMPLGTGEKIRGARYYCLLIDEMAQVPSEILDVVIRPMGATAANPMERVKYVKKLKAAEARGEDISSFLQEGVNKLIGVSSAYYTFNHMYQRIERYEEEVKNGSTQHAVHYISYKDMPEGFLDENNIREAEASMPKHLFDMEYRSIWTSNSSGVFKASLLEAAKKNSCGIKLLASPGKSYIMGVDPARSSDAFAISVFEVGNPANLVYCRKSQNNKFPEMADIIFGLADIFNVELIMMDAGSGGGGVALKDLLADPEKYGSRAILDMDDPEYMETTGRKILQMFNPSTKTNAEAVYSTLTLLEKGILLLPTPPLNGVEDEDLVYEVVAELYKQLVSINITETSTGQAKFDVEGGSGHGRAKKDLFSSFILAGSGLYSRIFGRPEEENPMHNIGGLLIPKNRVRHKYEGWRQNGKGF
jgi:hypothetical protein